MDSFPDRTHVRLWVREYGEYAYAGEDGEGFGRSAYVDGLLHAVWAVHRLVRNDTDYVLFHSASYGRYLALNLVPADDEDEDEPGVEYYHPGLCTYDSPEQENVLFEARRVEDGTDDIFLSNPRFGDWYHSEDADLPIHWVVEAIPARQFPPALPLPPPVNPPPAVSGRIGGQGAHVPAVLPPAVLRRRINYVRADDQGNFNPLHWRVLEPFEGQSVFKLRRDLAAELGEANNNGFGIRLCVWGGSQGRWTPLVIDLPPDEKTMYIVVLTTGSPAALALRYADVDPDENAQ